MITTTYCAAELFTVRESVPIQGNPIWTDLRIESNKSLLSEEVRGAGLYAIHYQDRLLYIGQFRGTKVNPIAGDVCATRWAKHLSTLTLRDRRISFGPRALRDMTELDRPPAPLVDLIGAAELPTITSHRGRVSSLNRGIFAGENWQEFSQIRDSTGLRDFEITYSKIDRGSPFSDSQIRVAVEQAEESVISLLRPRCNAKIRYGTANEMNRVETAFILEQALESSFEGLGQEIPIAHGQDEHAELHPNAAFEENLEIDDAVLVTDEEAFYFSLNKSEDAISAVDRVMASFERIDDAYIWFTKTGAGDLRIRSIAGPRRFLNVARIYWQPRLRRFQSEINLSVERCIELGATTANSNYAGKPLPTLASFDIPAATDALVRCLIDAAEQNRLASR